MSSFAAYLVIFHQMGQIFGTSDLFSIQRLVYFIWSEPKCTEFDVKVPDLSDLYPSLAAVVCSARLFLTAGNKDLMKGVATPDGATFTVVGFNHCYHFVWVSITGLPLCGFLSLCRVVGNHANPRMAVRIHTTVTKCLKAPF